LISAVQRRMKICAVQAQLPRHVQWALVIETCCTLVRLLHLLS